jgi:hypothetical protein
MDCGPGAEEHKKWSAHPLAELAKEHGQVHLRTHNEKENCQLMLTWEESDGT